MKELKPKNVFFKIECILSLFIFLSSFRSKFQKIMMLDNTKTTYDLLNCWSTISSLKLSIHVIVAI